jgi:hypothetical protein
MEQAEINHLRFSEYMKLTPRTLSNIYNVHDLEVEKMEEFAFAKLLDLVHMQIGVVTETFELLEADIRKNFGEEIADKAWYLSNWLYIQYNYNVCPEPVNINYFSSAMTHEERRKELNRLDELFLDDAKKRLAYNKETKVTKYEVETYLSLLVNYCNFYGYEFEELLYRNIEKLKVRFKEKFTTTEAINRDVKKENNVL